VAYDKNTVKHALDGFGFLVQPKLNLALLGAIFNSSLFEDRAPENKHLLTCFVGGAGKPEFADIRNENIKQRVISELNELIGTTSNPEIINEIYWPQAIPNYALNHYKLQEKLDDFETKHPQIKLLGNWRSGISLPQRVDEAFLNSL